MAEKTTVAEKALPANIFTNEVDEVEADGPQTDHSSTLSPKLVNIILLQGPGSAKPRAG